MTSAEARARWASWLLVALLIGWSGWMRWRLLSSSPFPLGVDGYFYPVQLRSILTTGRLYYPSAPLALYALAPLAAATDPIIGAKLGSALAGALLAVPMYVLGHRIGANRAAGVLAAALATTSTMSMYLSVEFVKNLLGLVLVASYLATLGWALQTPSMRRAAITLVVLFAAMATHPTAAALVLVTSMPPLIVAWRRGLWSPPRRWLGLLGAFLAAWLVLALATPTLIPAAPPLRLLGSLVGQRWDFTIPVLHGPGQALRLGHEALLAAVVSLLALLTLLAPVAINDQTSEPRRSVDRALVIGPALVAVGAGLPFLDVTDPAGLGFRLRLLTFVPLALSAALLAGIALRRCSGAMGVAAVIIIALAWVLTRPPGPVEGIVRTDPVMQAAVRSISGLTTDDAVVIVPSRQLVFMTTWYTAIPTRLTPSAVAIERRWRLLPRAFISDSLAAVLQTAHEAPAIERPYRLHPRHPNGLVLMSEATWQWALAQLPADEQRRYRRWPTI